MKISTEPTSVNTNMLGMLYYIISAEFTPDNKYLCVLQNFLKPYFSCVHTGEKIFELDVKTMHYPKIVFSNDSKYAAIYDHHSPDIEVYNLKTKKHVFSIPNTEEIKSISYSKDNSQILITLTNYESFIYDALTGCKLTTLPKAYLIKFLSNKHIIFVDSKRKIISILDNITQEIICSKTFADAITDIDVNSDNSKLLIAFKKKPLRVFDLVDFKITESIFYIVNCAASKNFASFSHNKKWLFDFKPNSNDSTIFNKSHETLIRYSESDFVHKQISYFRFWSAATGKHIHSVIPTKALKSASLNNACNKIATVFWDNSILIWNIE